MLHLLIAALIAYQPTPWNLRYAVQENGYTVWRTVKYQDEHECYDDLKTYVVPAYCERDPFYA